MPAEYLLANQPDILEVIANLSNDEVFTPPKVANAVLDLLPPEVWTDPSLRWLDPGCKTGVFPREITKRLMVGLADAIPDEDKRLHHILTEMVFAIAITELTGMMSRRTLYCSKDAASEYSAVRLSGQSGNIWHERTEHAFDERGRCAECGGAKQQLEAPGRDNYAYGFIHGDGRSKIQKELGMKFDVIVGNPPYQMEDGGNAASAQPLYDVFVSEAIALNPKYVSMIIPSRWMQGGKGLDAFREKMLTDKRLRYLRDFSQMKTLFPGVDFEGGVCYFLWNRDTPGPCMSEYVQGDVVIGPVERQLDEFDTFVRDPRALPVLMKVLKQKESSLMDLVSARNPFGLATNFTGYRRGEKQKGDLKAFTTDSGKRMEKYVDADRVTKGLDRIKHWKVFVPMAYGERGAIPARVIGPTIVAGSWSVCTDTYLCISPLKDAGEAKSLDSYIGTRFFRFLVSLRKISQHATRSTYQWVPQQTWDRTWTDVELYKKYGITADEQAYIEAMIKEMPA